MLSLSTVLCLHRNALPSHAAITSYKVHRILISDGKLNTAFYLTHFIAGDSF